MYIAIKSIKCYNNNIAYKQTKHHWLATNLAILALLAASTSRAYGENFVLDFNTTQTGVGEQTSQDYIVQGGLEPSQTAGTANGMQMQPLAAAAYCGNGIRENGEDCDGTDFGSATCQSQGFSAGSLQCNAACSLIVSGCSAATSSAAGGSNAQQTQAGGGRGNRVPSRTFLRPSAPARPSSSRVQPKPRASSRLQRLQQFRLRREMRKLKRMQRNAERAMQQQYKQPRSITPPTATLIPVHPAYEISVAALVGAMSAIPFVLIPRSAFLPLLFLPMRWKRKRKARRLTHSKKQ